MRRGGVEGEMGIVEVPWEMGRGGASREGGGGASREGGGAAAPLEEGPGVPAGGVFGVSASLVFPLLFFCLVELSTRP